MPKFNRITEAEIDLRTFFNPEGNLMTPEASEDSFIFQLPLNVWSLLRRATIDEVVGAPGVLFVVDGSPAADAYWYVLACAMTHSDVVAQILTLGIANPGPFPRNTSVGNASQAPSTALAVIRPFLVPPGMVIRGEAIALGAAAVLTLRVVRVELKLAEIAPYM